MSNSTEVMTREQAQEIEQKLEHAPPGGLDVGTAFMAQLEPRWRLCKALVASGMIPQKSPEAALAVMLKGFELGVPPMQAFSSIHYFDGKLVTEAALMDAVASQQLGVRKKVLEWTDTVCRIRFTRDGWDPVEAEFTMKDAETAGLTVKKNWKQYPKDMLAARAKARGLRMIAPDYFAGMLAQEEVGPVNHDTNGGAPDLDEVNRKLQEKAGAAGETPEPMEAEVVVDEPDAEDGESEEEEPTEANPDPLADTRAEYESLLDEACPDWSDAERMLFQEQKIGKADPDDFTREDFELGILLVKRGQTDIKVPRTEQEQPQQKMPV